MGELINLISDWSRLPAVWITAVGRGKHARVEKQSKTSSSPIDGWGSRTFEGIAEAREWGMEYAKKNGIPFLKNVPSPPPFKGRKVVPRWRPSRSAGYTCNHCGKAIIIVYCEFRSRLGWICDHCMTGGEWAKKYEREDG